MMCWYIESLSCVEKFYVRSEVNLRLALSLFSGFPTKRTLERIKYIWSKNNHRHTAITSTKTKITTGTQKETTNKTQKSLKSER